MFWWPSVVVFGRLYPEQLACVREQTDDVQAGHASMFLRVVGVNFKLVATDSIVVHPTNSALAQAWQ